LKSRDVYVCPQRHHWPVFDAEECKYVDALDYKQLPGDPVDDRESMLDLSRQEAWALAPVLIFMDLVQERGKKTMAKTYTLKKMSISRAEWARKSVKDGIRSRKLLAAYKWLVANNARYKFWKFCLPNGIF